MPIRLLLLLILLLPLLAHAQGQWKWRDAQGRVQFSDRPPPQGTPDKDILKRPANAPLTVQVQPFGQAPASAAEPKAAAASSPQERSAALDKARKDRESEAKLKAQEQREKAARAENCSNARQSMASLEAGLRVARFNEKGERVILDDAQRAAEIKRMQAVVASECR